MKKNRRKNHAALGLARALAVCACACALLAAATRLPLAQSGRNKGAPPPLTDEAAPAQSASHGAQPSSTKTSANEGDDEVVRISSNLVPVPASVVDPRARCGGCPAVAGRPRPQA